VYGVGLDQADLSLNLRTPNPGFSMRFTPLFYITNAGGDPRVKPGQKS
jgi:hypothetical protein